MAINTNISGIKLDSATDDNKIPVYDAASNSFLMETPSAGSGDVTKVGTPVDNQVGVWTGDGTIEGDVDLTFDTSTNTLGVGLVGLDGRVQVHAVKSDASDGLLIEASNGTDVGLLGVGNTANATWNGSHNFEGGQVAVGKSATTLGKLKLYGNTSGDVTIQPNAVAGTGVVLTAPATTGTLALTSDIPAAGANTALSNLASVAINTSLVSDTDNTDDLGTTLKKWANLFVTTIGATATRVTKGWFTDLEVTNAITGSVTGNAGTATALQTARTIGTLTGDVTSTGSSFDGTGNNTNSTTVTKINGTSLAGLATGVLKNTTTTGVPFISKVALTEPATAATLTIADNKTVTVNNTLTLAGTDSTTMTFPTTSATIARTDAANTFTGVQTFSTPIAATSVATMTATVGGGVPTPPNNTTTFLRGDGTFAAPAASTITSAVRAYLTTSAQTVSTGYASRATVQFNAESFDVDGEFNTGTYTFTPAATGKYQLNIHIGWNNWASSDCELYLVIGGVENLVKTFPNAGSGAWTMDYSDLVTLTATSSTVLVKVAQYTGGNRNISTGEYVTNFSIKRVS